MTTLIQRFLSIGWIIDDNECWIWNGSKAHKRGGYGQISNGRNNVLKAHRVSYEYFNGEIPNGLIVRHICDNPPCINPKHLLVGTTKDNARDAIERSRATHQVMSGEMCPASKLTWEQVLEIRSSKESYGKLSKKYNVSKTAIANIIKNKVWKDQGSVTTRRI